MHIVFIKFSDDITVASYISTFFKNLFLNFEYFQAAQDSNSSIYLKTKSLGLECLK